MASSSSSAQQQQLTDGEQRSQAYTMMAKLCVQKFVEALRNDVFPDEATEKMFGVVMNDTANDGLGDTIYRAWQEIYKRRLLVHQGPATSLHLEDELVQAITTNRLAPTFREWALECCAQQQQANHYCSLIMSRNLNMDFVIHPTNDGHRQWMERFRTELATGTDSLAAAAAAAAGETSTATMTGSGGSSNNMRFCQHCGRYDGSNRRCSSCKEVYYCSKDHQKIHYKQHKTCCKAVAADPVSVWIEVQEGEGSGLGNHQINHIFSNKAHGMAFVQNHFGSGPSVAVSPPLRSPFCELAGWDVEIYCSLNDNRVDVGGQECQAMGQVRGHMNAAGVYLGSHAGDGLTRYNNLQGPIFVTGRRKMDGKPLNKDILWGILNFIWDAMDLYDGTSNLPRNDTLQEWATMYQNETWVPQGGDGGVNVYSSDYVQGARDHR